MTCIVIDRTIRLFESEKSVNLVPVLCNLLSKPAAKPGWKVFGLLKLHIQMSFETKGECHQRLRVDSEMTMRACSKPGLWLRWHYPFVSELYVLQFHQPTSSTDIILVDICALSKTVSTDRCCQNDGAKLVMPCFEVNLVQARVLSGLFSKK